jgi:hypothetical protein
MQTPPEIIFHDADRSPWVESYILERMQRLEKFADGITSCRAACKTKVIGDMPAQLPALINLTFGALERQLKKTAALRRGQNVSS